MSDLFDTRSVDDAAEHWDALAERVAREAARQSFSTRQVGVVSVVASRAGVIAAAVLLAASLAFMTMAGRQGSSRPSVELGQALAPSDDVGRAIALTARPPAVAALLFDQPRASGRQP